jgi:hypothetical protein
MKKKLLTAALAIVAIAFTMTGCIEHRYYHQNHRHSPDYERRHQPRVDVNIHN